MKRILLLLLIILPGWQSHAQKDFFVPQILSDSLLINEINYHSAIDFEPGDWIEFYNPHNYPLDISGWMFKDELDTHVYTFPSGTLVPTQGYIVLAEVPSAFDSLFPSVTNFLGPIGFGFSGNGELLRLYDDTGMMVDTVHYDDVAPWPTGPDGNGPTLELINPGLDNAVALSWASSCTPHGTPGALNCAFVSVPSVSPGKSAVSFHIIPNPIQTSAKIIIETDQTVSEGTFAVYNLVGIEVMRIEHISSKIININRGNLLPGSYYYRFTDKACGVTGSGILIIN